MALDEFVVGGEGNQSRDEDDDEEDGDGEDVDDVGYSLLLAWKDDPF